MKCYLYCKEKKDNSVTINLSYIHKFSTQQERDLVSDALIKCFSALWEDEVYIEFEDTMVLRFMSFLKEVNK